MQREIINGGCQPVFPHQYVRTNTIFEIIKAGGKHTVWSDSGSDRAQLANMAKQAKAVLKTETLEAVADRGYFSSLEIPVIRPAVDIARAFYKPSPASASHSDDVLDADQVEIC